MKFSFFLVALRFETYFLNYPADIFLRVLYLPYPDKHLLSLSFGINIVVFITEYIHYRGLCYNYLQCCSLLFRLANTFIIG